MLNGSVRPFSARGMLAHPTTPQRGTRPLGSPRSARPSSSRSYGQRETPEAYCRHLVSTFTEDEKIVAARHRMMENKKRAQLKEYMKVSARFNGSSEFFPQKDLGLMGQLAGMQVGPSFLSIRPHPSALPAQSAHPRVTHVLWNCQSGPNDTVCPPTPRCPCPKASYPIRRSPNQLYKSCSPAPAAVARRAPAPERP